MDILRFRALEGDRIPLLQPVTAFYGGIIYQYFFRLQELLQKGPGILAGCREETVYPLSGS